MQAVRAHNASFAWSTRFKSAGGRDIIPLLFEEKGALVFYRNRERRRFVRVFAVLILCFTAAPGGYSGNKIKNFPTVLISLLRPSIKPFTCSVSTSSHPWSLFHVFPLDSSDYKYIR